MGKIVMYWDTGRVDEHIVGYNTQWKIHELLRNKKFQDETNHPMMLLVDKFAEDVKRGNDKYAHAKLVMDFITECKYVADYEIGSLLRIVDMKEQNWQEFNETMENIKSRIVMFNG